MYFLNLFSVTVTIFSGGWLCAGDDQSAAALLEAAGAGETAQVRQLIGGGVNVNVREKNGWTPLMKAAVWSRNAVINLLLSSGANVNAQNEEGRTALMYVAEHGSMESVRILLKAGADGIQCPGIYRLALFYRRLKSGDTRLGRGCDTRSLYSPAFVCHKG